MSGCLCRAGIEPEPAPGLVRHMRGAPRASYRQMELGVCSLYHGIWKKDFSPTVARKHVDEFLVDERVHVLAGLVEREPTSGPAPARDRLDLLGRRESDHASATGGGDVPRSAPRVSVIPSGLSGLREGTGQTNEIHNRDGFSPCRSGV